MRGLELDPNHIPELSTLDGRLIFAHEIIGIRVNFLQAI